MNNTIAGMFKACNSFPMSITKYFDPWVKAFVGLHIAFEEVMFHYKGIKGGMEQAKKDSVLEYVLTPSSRSLSSLSTSSCSPFFLFPRVWTTIANASCATL